MRFFSQRIGRKPSSKGLQLESFDHELLNLLWNVVGKHFLASEVKYAHFTWPEIGDSDDVLRAVWKSFFKMPHDQIPYTYADARKKLYGHVRSHFYANDWTNAPDLIEFLLGMVTIQYRHVIELELNAALELENSGYRLIGGQFTEITNDGEQNALREAMSVAHTPTQVHLGRALTLMTDRSKRDFPNSIKESISAVEAYCRMICGDEGATLGVLLGRLKADKDLHPALLTAFSKLYGYTCDSGGIRHALNSGSAPPELAEAQFMLVACSAFINYLKCKASKK